MGTNSSSSKASSRVTHCATHLFLGPMMKKLIKWARCVKLSEDEILFKEGDPIERMYFVRAGYMHVTDADDGNRGLLLGAGALMDAGRLKGSGKNTEKRQKYITTARVARNCRSAEIFAISMRTYNSALKKLWQITKSKDFQVLKETALFHDLNHSDLLRIYNHSDLREYSPGSHILRRVC